jgi:hypothetical protein
VEQSAAIPVALLFRNMLKAGRIFHPGLHEGLSPMRFGFRYYPGLIAFEFPIVHIAVNRHPEELM